MNDYADKISSAFDAPESVARWNGCLKRSISARLGSTASAIRDDVERIRHELSEFIERFREGTRDLAETLEQYRSRSEENEWPTVLVAAKSNRERTDLVDRLGAMGIALVPRKNGDSDPGRKFASFDLVHVTIPPDSLFLEILARESLIDSIADADAPISLPDPITPSRLSSTPPLSSTREMLWPPDQERPDDLNDLGVGIRLAILDTGVDENHPDLLGRILATENFSSSPDTLDRLGHGTHCVGIAAGNGAASEGAYTGVAPHAEILSGKVLNDHGLGSISDIIEGLEWARENRADVINLSLGGPGYADGRSVLSRVCGRLAEEGTIVSAAAGNRGPGAGTIGVPADAPGAIAVGAIDREYRVASFSSRGPSDRPEWTGTKPNVVCPGVDVVSCRSRDSELDGDSYATMTGTSMACPHFAGAAAVVLSYFRSKGIEEAARRTTESLVQSARFLPGYSSDDQGNGLIQIPKALLDAGEGRIAAGWEAIRSRTAADVEEALRCGSCGKSMVTILDETGTCEADRCDAVICNACWTVKRNQFCSRHRTVSAVGKVGGLS